MRPRGPGLFCVPTLGRTFFLPALKEPRFRRWVQEFLNEENRGLDVLLDYLAFAQCSVT